jgi:hypothetical protein
MDSRSCGDKELLQFGRDIVAKVDGVQFSAIFSPIVQGTCCA